MFNKVILLGRITQDLALKTTPQGASVLSFTVACDRRFQQKGEERKSDFFNCVAWRNEAEFISRYWTKGRPILIEGELQNRSYVDKNGVTRYITEVIVDRATFTGDSRQGGTANSYQGAGYPAEPPVQQHPAAAANAAPAASNGSFTAQDFAATSPTDDDYPF